MDESGDPGFAFQRGSSRYLVLALLLVDDPIPLHQAVHDLRLALGLPERQEFKFAATSNQWRRAFFVAIRPYPFRAYSLVLDKRRWPAAYPSQRRQLYPELVESLLAFVGEQLRDALLVLDEAVQSGERQARFATALRHTLHSTGTQPVARVVQHRSHSDNLIQVADMVAGAVARAYERGDTQYSQLLRRKLEVLELPSETPHGPRG
ncbi:MAG TPA: DUF3800 domain-containing protein [Chloroflexota bacterium]